MMPAPRPVPNPSAMGLSTSSMNPPTASAPEDTRTSPCEVDTLDATTGIQAVASAPKGGFAAHRAESSAAPPAESELPGLASTIAEADSVHLGGAGRATIGA